MIDAWMLLPDFGLIALGWALARYTKLDRPIWQSAETLVYYVLFPALLVNSTLRNPVSIGTALPLAGGAWLMLGCAIALAYACARLPGADARLHASGAQVSFRFNSYIGLALADRLGGAPGVATMALLIAASVPPANVAAVWPMARHGGHSFARELARNPLIVATVAGLVLNLLGIALPALAMTTLARLGSAAVPLGLLAVGAGLGMGALQRGTLLGAAFLAIRHGVAPLVAAAWSITIGLPPPQALILVAFAALPTASSCFVLAARMGGDAPYVAGLVTVSTLIAMAAIPLTLLGWQAVGR